MIRTLRALLKRCISNFTCFFFCKWEARIILGLSVLSNNGKLPVCRWREDKSGDKQDVSVIWLWDSAGEQDSLFWAGSVLEQPAPIDRPVSNTEVEPGKGGTQPLIRGIKTLLQITTCQTKEWKCTLLLGSHYYYPDLLSFQLFPWANHLSLCMQHWAFLSQNSV